MSTKKCTFPKIILDEASKHPAVFFVGGDTIFDEVRDTGLTKLIGNSTYFIESSNHYVVVTS